VLAPPHSAGSFGHEDCIALPSFSRSGSACVEDLLGAQIPGAVVLIILRGELDVRAAKGWLDFDLPTIIITIAISLRAGKGFDVRGGTSRRAKATALHSHHGNKKAVLIAQDGLF
jgi:hypothetical protein